MGLGKTLQALSIAYYYRDQWPLLIVVPSSLRYPWIDEVEKWFPEIDPAHINLIQAGTDTAYVLHVLTRYIRVFTSNQIQMITGNVDIFACIHFREIERIGNFAWM